MLIILSAILGMSTSAAGWWWFPAAGGMVGQALHYATSARYRRELLLPGALTAAALSTALLTAACHLAFAVGRWFAGAL